MLKNPQVPPDPALVALRPLAEISRSVRGWRVEIALVLALLALGWGAHRANRVLEGYAQESRAPGEVGPLPNGQALRILSLGFERLVADLFWLRTVYYVGDERSHAAGYPAAPRLARLVTDIDPYFTSAYVHMNSVLSVLMKAPRDAYTLLEKGLRYNDHDWRLHFLQGFTLFFDLEDYGPAAERMRAAFDRGGPPYLQLLAARLYAEAGTPETAMVFIAARLREEANSEARERLERRYRDLWITRDLARIETAIAEFERERGRAPRSYSELLDAALLIPEPRDPAGDAYLLHNGEGATRHAYEQLELGGGGE